MIEPKSTDQIKKGITKEESEEYLKSYVVETPKINVEPKSTDPINEPLPCVCGNKDHKAGLIIKKWGSLADIVEDKVKVQIFEGDEIKSVVVDRKKLMERLNGIKNAR